MGMSISKPLPRPQESKIGPSGIFRFLPPPPLFILQPLLTRIVRKVAVQRPELFARLGDSCNKRFLIDPQNMPFMLMLLPNAEQPQLTAIGRGQEIAHDVLISATFLTLLKMIDGRSDGDALFFSRDLRIEGDTEAVVALRNALDDMDGTLVDEVVATFGPLSGPLRRAVDFLERSTNSK